jgi:hypothetical protein
MSRADAGPDALALATMLQPLYTLLDHASKEWYKEVPLIPHRAALERGPHFHLIPAQIRSLIPNVSPPCFTYRFSLKRSGRAICIHIHSLESTHDPAEMVRLMWIWLQALDTILVKTAHVSTCSLELHIYVFLTSHRKQWPKIISELEAKPKAGVVPKAEPKPDIEEIHVNSGFTMPCGKNGPNQIYVYREEEWFKVLIHETIHAFGLDFSTADLAAPDTRAALAAIDTVFPGVAAAGGNRICLFEAYTECWAEWIAILFRVHEFGRGGRLHWKSDFVRHLALERQWSMMQASRMRAWYNSDPIRMYRNHIPIFAYYILKSVLMDHCVAFGAWCKSHNSHMVVFNLSHIDAFGEFLRDHAIDHAIDMPHEHKDASSSLRMSLWGD